MAKCSDRIKELRSEAGLTQEQLAGKINVSRAAINRWEKGENTPSDKYVLLLAGFFKVSIAYLMGNVDVRDMIVVDEEEARQKKEDEDYLLTCYRTLSPEMKKMIRVMANYALIIDRDRKEK